MSGEDAPKHVAKESKQGPEKGSNLQDLEEFFVQGIPQNLKHAIRKIVQVTFLNLIWTELIETKSSILKFVWCHENLFSFSRL